MKIVLSALTLLFATGVAYAGQLVEVDTLNQTLKKQHAHWVAKETSVSSLTQDEMMHRLGANMPSAQGIEFYRSNPMVTPNLPSVLDWRNKDGVNWVTPILDQGNCGSCVAFASVATLETQYRISTGLPSFNVRLSPQYLFNCGDGSCSYGWQPEDAAAFIQNNGIPDEACMPYLSGATGQDVSCQSACPDASQRMVRISSYSRPSSGYSNDVNAVKQALQRGPLVTTLYVYADFMAYGGGVYNHVSGKMLGGHAISIVGYDDNRQAFIIRNSWGTTWGENGFGYVSYSDTSGVGDETWSFAIPSSAGAVSVGSPIDYAYFSKNADVKVESTFNGTDSIEVSFFDASGKAVVFQTFSGKSVNQSVDVSALADGQYWVQAKVMDASGHALGQSARQAFYVANEKPQLTLSFTGDSGTDLSKPLTDRIQVQVHPATSSRVPMSSVEFHYRGADGVDKFRAAATVLDGMLMGWRTNLLPNGQYEIWMVGHVATNQWDQKIETPHITVTTQN